MIRFHRLGNPFVHEFLLSHGRGLFLTREKKGSAEIATEYKKPSNIANLRLLIILKNAILI